MRIQNIGSYNSNGAKATNRNTLSSQPSFGRVWAEHVSWGANYIKDKGKTNFKLFSFPDAKAVFVEVADKATAGIGNIKDRLVKVIAAGAAAGATLKTIDDTSKLYPMKDKGDGIYEAKGIKARPNDNYRFVIVTKDDKINMVKDPYAKKQENIHGWSTIYDQNAYKWENTDWIEGKDPRRIVRNPDEPLRGLGKLIIDEVNIPTLSLDGTFESAKTRIDEIAARKNATAVEFMPVENTFSKQWGYDGVDKFAVNEKLGGPDKLKELIDYTHGKGLNVIMDMVPNHMGPDGNYLGQTGPYVKCGSEFGDKLNYEGENSKYVRDWMTNAALWWANEFKVDGIRFDLTSFVDSDWLLRQIAVELNEHNPKVFLIAEDHRHKQHNVTSYYHNDKATHLDELNFIDMSVDNISKGWWTIPWSIGFDSEWDSEYKEALTDLVLTPGANLLDKLDNYLKSSHYRVKYGYSHDEIGNEDGTRFIPKYIVRHLDLYNKVYGNSDSEKGQRAAHAAQKLAELTVSENFENMNNQELNEAENKIGINTFISHYDLANVFKTAVAKQKLILGTVMTTPGPKMFFQGDDEADLSYFKFFREFAGEKADRKEHPEIVQDIINKKGYDTLEEIARPDSVVGRIKPSGIFKDLKTQMLDFDKDLKAILDNHPALSEGEIISTYKDNNHNVHIHQLKAGEDELLVIKNFGHGFHQNSYEYFGFPQNSTWTEVFSSDDKKYGGMGYSNAGRTDITNINQHLSLAPNSFIILKKIG